MAFLELSHVEKSFPSKRGRSRVLSDVSLEIAEREFVAILGFSGSGKTTLISLLAGLSRPDSGKITLRGKPILGPSPERGVVFQNYSLLAWLSALENVALAVDRAYPAWPAKKRREHSIRYLEMVNLGHALVKKPSELFGAGCAHAHVVAAGDRGHLGARAEDGGPHHERRRRGPVAR